MTTLPPELVSLCLSHLNPTDRATVPTLLSCSLVSSSFRALATANSLWRPIADARFHKYRVPSRSRLEEFERDAFRYYASRARKDQRATEIVKEIQRPTDRIPLIEELRSNSALGSEVIENPKWTSGGDYAFTEQNAPEDWLSLRYWAAECRKALLRDEALRLWRDISIRSVANADTDDADNSDDQMEEDLERGLDAFSAFRGLDPARLARERYDMSNHPRLLEATAVPPPHFTGVRLLEWLATQVVDYIKSIGLEPAREGGFHSLDNHYVELVWRRAAATPDGPQNEGTLPMTLVHIFCALVRRLPVARRLGIRAQMIGYPGTVLAGLSYRRRGGGGGGGEEEDRERDRARIYINVFGEGKILSPERLRAMLGAMGQADSEQDFLAPASAREMCLRVARNILTSVRAGDRTIGVPIPHELSVEALYSVSHALFLFTSPHALLDRDRDRDRREEEEDVPAAVGADTLQYAEWLESLVQSEYPLDVSYLSETVAPLLPSSDRQTRLRSLCAAIREEDATPKEPKVVNAEIKWPIGHVFRHRLFGYLAITRGFDYRCEAGEQWIRQMRVDTLPYGRHQPFYHVVVEDGSARYVAQENITDSAQYPVSDAEVDSFLEQESLGRYFRCRKRVHAGAGVGRK
ncbi:hypothetical protein B0A53_05684 [Rhodotorula sp. CCFEE 5036]|nr:hypothetical protein B0A53_05684 [Rhodotorula sp. CCFEE 5036]